MDQIKFRAYDGKKLWYSDSDKDRVCFSFAGPGGWGVYKSYVDQFGTITEKLVFGKEDNPGTAVLMQYTGFKDKDGKDIYEGDVLVCIGYNGEMVKDSVFRYYGTWYVGHAGAETHNYTALQACKQISIIGTIFD